MNEHQAETLFHANDEKQVQQDYLRNRSGSTHRQVLILNQACERALSFSELNTIDVQSSYTLWNRTMSVCLQVAYCKYCS